MTETTADILARLVAYPTVTFTPNLEMIGYVADHLRAYGFECEVLPQPDGISANLFATIGPRTDGGLVLSAHADVVPVEGQPWTTDPYTLTPKGSRLVGRGACDMKGFLASAMAMAPVMAKADLKRPIHICLTADEELGMTGVRAVVAKLGADWVKPALCVVGEPSLMKVVTGHKGFIMLRTHVRGHEVHSSDRYKGVSAVMVAARLVTWIEDYDFAQKAKAERDGGAPHFHPSWTVFHVGTIEGGTAHNITARDCRFPVTMRLVPGDDGEAHVAAYMAHVRDVVEPAMKAVHPDTFIAVERSTGVAPLEPEVDGAAERLTRRVTGDNAITVVPYGAEAGIFQKAGLSTVICGPGDIAQAHQPDEWIERSQLDKCDRFIEGLVAEWSKPS